MAAKNSSDNSDRLLILKCLQIERFIKLDFSKVENNFIFQNIDLINKIYKLGKGFDYTSNIINEIIDLYINDFSY